MVGFRPQVEPNHAVLFLAHRLAGTHRRRFVRRRLGCGSFHARCRRDRARADPTPCFEWLSSILDRKRTASGIAPILAMLQQVRCAILGTLLVWSGNLGKSLAKETERAATQAALFAFTTKVFLRVQHPIVPVFSRSFLRFRIEQYAPSNLGIGPRRHRHGSHPKDARKGR